MNKKLVKIRSPLTPQELIIVHRRVPEFVDSEAPPRNFAELEERYKGKNDVLMIVADVPLSETTGEGVGYLLGYHEPKYGDNAYYLDLIGVDPDYRKFGVFSALEEKMVTFAREKGYERIVVKTWKMRVDMQRTLSRRNYILIQTDPRTPDEQTRLIYEKTLN